MIRSGRTQHRIVFSCLAVLLPLLFLAALAARPTLPVARDWPNSHGTRDLLAGAERVASFGGDAVQVDLLKRRNGYVLFTPKRVEGPDVLVYVSSDIAAGRPPVDARLMGSASDARRGLLWRGAEPRNGEEILFYSLAHDAVIARVPVVLEEDLP